MLAFPGVFRGALDCHARMINDEMGLAVARARAVEQAARRTGVSRRYLFEEMEQGNMFNFITT